jgi:oxidase EvaA
MSAMDYRERFLEFKSSVEGKTSLSDWILEFTFESLRDESLMGNLDETRHWYRQCVLENKLSFERIPLSDCRMWKTHDQSGSLVHESGGFFRVEGIRVKNSPTREVVSGWDQPIIAEVGYDGGILGLLRKRFQGVPHYLVEAKAEPGNFRIVQITTTIQATFSNLMRLHEGNATYYSAYFTNPQDYGAAVLFSNWLSEDGGRLLNKRNRAMLVEVPENHEVELASPSFRWVSLYQIKRLLLLDEAVVTPHLRGVISIV